jgi:hypothetical protein
MEREVWHLVQRKTQSKTSHGLAGGYNKKRAVPGPVVLLVGLTDPHQQGGPKKNGPTAGFDAWFVACIDH